MFDTENGNEELVRAANPAHAVRHVVRDRYRAQVAAQEEIVSMLTAGKKVLDATTGQQELPEPEEAKAPASGKSVRPDSDYPDES